MMAKISSYNLLKQTWDESSDSNQQQLKKVTIERDSKVPVSILKFSKKQL